MTVRLLPEPPQTPPPVEEQETKVVSARQVICHSNRCCWIRPIVCYSNRVGQVIPGCHRIW